ncbi:GNAT family N-acetyltransferase [Pseudonocardia nigra]|uniref:GNAT family N-acetyltransferase n=1 Tax=Pseudonocardia nigra TaxID=1921578 RepID=UPI001C5EACEB|nr:GNAT family N-acetyltransferase [Pseudonocardia nigra]
MIRPARADDLGGVVEVFLACWTTSYASFDLPAMDRDRATGLWRTALADSAAFIAEDGAVLGVTRCTAAAGRVDSLYVHPRAQGTGLGVRLLATCTEHLREAGARTATLWVFAPNAPARAFYERQGWRPTGRERVEPEYGVPEIELERSLA